MDEKQPQNPHPANDPNEPNPGDPPGMPEPRRPSDPFADGTVPVEEPPQPGV